MSFRANVLVWIVLLFVGCMSNHVLLEMLVTSNPGIGPLVTFTYFVTPVLEGLRHVFIWNRTGLLSRFIPSLAPLHTPFWLHLLMVAFYFSLSLLNNIAFRYHVPMPLHTVFRSASLVTNLAIGYLFLKKRYPTGQTISVVLITFGIIVATFASSEHVASKSETAADELLVGVAILVITSFLSSGLGVIQEYAATRFGKNPDENLFYSHFLSIPLFAMVSGDLWENLWVAFASEPVPLFGGAIAVPLTVLLLIATNFTQLLCIKSVFNTIANTDSLTLTMLITLRKFLSVVISVIYFGNPFTLQHWIGTVAVFVGSYIFVKYTPPRPGAAPQKQKSS